MSSLPAQCLDGLDQLDLRVARFSHDLDSSTFNRMGKNNWENAKKLSLGLFESRRAKEVDFAQMGDVSIVFQEWPVLDLFS